MDNTVSIIYQKQKNTLTSCEIHSGKVRAWSPFYTFVNIVRVWNRLEWFEIDGIVNIYTWLELTVMGHFPNTLQALPIPAHWAFKGREEL